MRIFCITFATLFTLVFFLMLAAMFIDQVVGDPAHPVALGLKVVLGAVLGYTSVRLVDEWTS